MPVRTCAHVDMCADMHAHMCAHMCTDICVDIFVHMDADVCVGMRKACKCPYTRALMRAHMCAGGRTPNPADTKLAGTAVPGRTDPSQTAAFAALIYRKYCLI